MTFRFDGKGIESTPDPHRDEHDDLLQEETLAPREITLADLEGFDPDVGWKDWPIAPFPLRSMAEGVVEKLCATGFVLRDRKRILQALKMSDVDARDVATFYDIYLDIVEKHPWCAFVLACKAVQLCGSKRKPHRRVRGLPPEGFAAFSGPADSPMKHARATAFRSRRADREPLSTDDLLMLFFDYATDKAYAYPKIDVDIAKDMIAALDATIEKVRRTRGLGAESEGSGEGALGEAVDIAQEASRETSGEERAVPEDELDGSPEERSALLEALRGTVDALDAVAGLEAVDRVIAAAERLRASIEQAPRSDVTAIVERIETTEGIALPEGEATHAILESRAEEIVTALDRLDEACADRTAKETGLAGIRARVSVAMTSEDYAALTTLSGEAAGAKEALEASVLAEEERRRAIVALLTGAPPENSLSIAETERLAPDPETGGDGEGGDRDAVARNAGDEARGEPEAPASPVASDTATTGPTEPAGMGAMRAPVADDPSPVAAGATPGAEAQEETEEECEEEPLAPGLAGTDPGDTDPAEAGDLEAADASAARLAALLDRELVGVAARFANEGESRVGGSPVAADVLELAAASRNRFEDEIATQRFAAMANETLSRTDRSDADDQVLFGALLRPAIMKPTMQLRDAVASLGLGAFGPALQEVQQAIASLDHAFPPAIDDLARLSGSAREPRRKEIERDLASWREDMSHRSAICKSSTRIQHFLVGSKGEIGSTIEAILAGDEGALAAAHELVERFGTQTAINVRLREVKPSHGKSTAARFPTITMNYLYRNIGRSIGLVSAWIEAVERASGSRTPDAQARRAIDNLLNRLSKAASALRAAEAATTLETALGRWLAGRIEAMGDVLRGEAGPVFDDIDTAIEAELDLLPHLARRGLRAEGAASSPPSLESVLHGDILDPDAAVDANAAAGAFAAAGRVVHVFLPEGGRTAAIARIDAARQRFVAEHRDALENRERRLRTLAKIDLAHGDSVQRWSSWIGNAFERLDRLEAVPRGSIDDLADLADLPEHEEDFESFLAKLDATVRESQRERLATIRKQRPGVADDIDALEFSLENHTLEAIEDRIAHFRDGRSFASFVVDEDGPFEAFWPTFTGFALSEAWPRDLDGFAAEMAREGPLGTDLDRRKPALALLSRWLELRGRIERGGPDLKSVRATLEDLGVADARLSEMQRLGRPKAWSITLSARLPASNDWFCPPVFGSRARGRYRVVLMDAAVLPEQIVGELRSDEATFLLVAGVLDDKRRLEFAERLRAASIPALLADDAVIAFAAVRRDTRLRTLFDCGLPFGRVEPYITEAGALPSEMFFGRDEEVKAIYNKNERCLVYGGRQLGKSALLHHVAETHHDVERGVLVLKRDVLNLGTPANRAANVWAVIREMLEPHHGIVASDSRDSGAIRQDIRHWVLAKPGRRIVLLLDETDRFLAEEAMSGFPNVAALKELMEQTGRGFKVVFAGLHNVQRMHRLPNSPFAHLGEPILIGPLNATHADKHAAYRLVTAPMRAAGFRFEDAGAVEKILAYVNHYPSLAQTYCKGLLEQMHGAGDGRPYRLSPEGPLWRIPTAALFEGTRFAAIEESIRYKFHLTLELDPRYMLIAYTMAYMRSQGHNHAVLVSGLDPEEIFEEAQSHWPKSAEPMGLSGFVVLLDEMFELGVLGRVSVPNSRAYRYCLRSLQVANMLGTGDDVEVELLKLDELERGIFYDRATNRRPYAPDVKRPVGPAGRHEYCPLTDLQIERLVGGYGGGTKIVASLNELGLDRVGKALRKVQADMNLPGIDHAIEVVEAESPKRLGTEIDTARRASRPSKIVLHRPTGDAIAIAGLLQQLDRKPALIQGYVRVILLLDAANEATRELAISREAEAIAPWGEEMLRVHLSLVEQLGLDKPNIRSAILGATGGIPKRIIEVVNDLARMDRGSDHDIAASLDGLATPTLRVGVVTGGVREALDVLVAFGGGVDDVASYEALNELVRDAAGADLETMAPALRMLGLLRRWRASEGLIELSSLGRVA